MAETIQEHWERQLEYAQRAVQQAEANLGRIAMTGQLQLEFIESEEGVLLQFPQKTDPEPVVA